MLNVGLAGDYQYWKLLSLVMSLMVSFCAVVFRGISWMRSGTESIQFLKVFAPTL